MPKDSPTYVQRKRSKEAAKRRGHKVLVGENAGLRAQIAAFKEKAMVMVAQAVADTKQVAAGQLAEKDLVIQGKTDELRTFEAAASEHKEEVQEKEKEIKLLRAQIKELELAAKQAGIEARQATTSRSGVSPCRRAARGCAQTSRSFPRPGPSGIQRS